jgi:predicted nucleic acid-binding protein
MVLPPDEGVLPLNGEQRGARRGGHDGRVHYRCERDGVALGQKVHQADRWIATTALHLGVDLVSDDSAFENIDGLTILSRSTTSEPDRGS